MDTMHYSDLCGVSAEEREFISDVVAGSGLQLEKDCRCEERNAKIRDVIDSLLSPILVTYGTDGVDDKEAALHAIQKCLVCARRLEAIIS